MNAAATIEPAAVARPFWKIPGGKTQLLTELRKLVPPTFGRYFEPFVGGGALYFHLRATIGSIAATLGDASPYTILAYLAVRDQVEVLIPCLESMKRQHCETFYYATRDALNAGCADLTQAVRAMYLNKTCFNGVWRMNRKGQFNVPMGRYANPAIVGEDNLRACSRELQGARIMSGDFAVTVADAVAGDFVYMDPPYVPAGGYADFTDYTTAGFSEADQVRLRDLALELKARGVHVLLSNSDTFFVQQLYDIRRFHVRPVQARRAINSRTDKRMPVGELLIW